MTNATSQTVIGPIPDDWSVAPLSELCSTIIDGTHFTPRYVESGVPFYSVENVTADDFENTKFISLAEHELLTRRCRPARGDILLTRIGSLGDTKLIDWDVDASMYVSLALLKLRENVSPHFVYRYTKSQFFVRDVEKRSLLNAAPKKINMGEIGEVPIPIPPTLDEQNAIADALRDIDDLIASLNALIAKKRDIKQAAMRQLLTSEGERLAGFSGPWESKPLSNIADFITKGATPTTYGFGWQSDGILFLRSECVAGDGLDLSQSMFVSEEAHRALRRGEVRAGDILMTITGNVGRVVMLPPSIATANINQHIARIRIRYGEAVPRYIFHYLAQQTVRETFCSIVTGQAYPQISLRQVRDAIVPLPSLPEQEAIACVLSDMDDDIAVLEEKQSKAKRLRDGMMQQLLTGRIRLV